MPNLYGTPQTSSDTASRALKGRSLHRIETDTGIRLPASYDTAATQENWITGIQERATA